MSTAAVSDEVVELHRRLVAARNPDGGWPYHTGKASRLEPTAWAALALRDVAGAESDAVPFFGTRVRDDGLLADAAGVNFAANALAILSLDGHREGVDIRRRALTRVLDERGVKLAPATQYYQNNRLQAWSWLPGAFSWVEPTSWTLLAVKKGAPLLDGPVAEVRRRRVRDAERLLIDRSCVHGGWNYGNANMYGRELHAHVPTTAVALLAMQDRRDEPAVGRGLDFLVARRLSERTGMALALASIALRAFEQPSGDVGQALREWTRATHLASATLVTAMVAYALDGDRHGAAAFRL